MLINVMIGSPGGMDDSRQAIQGVIEEWNILHSTDQSAVLMPYRWESRAPSLVGQGSGQDVIDSRLVDKSHVLFAIFHHRFGTPTGAFGSGTEEEIERATRLGLRVHLMFSAEPGDITRIDLDQLREVRGYKARMSPRGIVREYADLRVLGEITRLALEDDVRTFKSEYRTGVAGHDGAELRVELDMVSAPGPAIVVRNDGKERVEDLVINRVTVGGNTANIRNSGIAAQLPVGATIRYGLYATPPQGQDVSVELGWSGSSGHTRTAIVKL